MAQFFQAHVAIDLQLNEEGLERYTKLSQAGFADNKYVLLQTALAQYHVRGTSLLRLSECGQSLIISCCFTYLYGHIYLKLESRDATDSFAKV